MSNPKENDDFVNNMHSEYLSTKKLGMKTNYLTKYFKNYTLMLIITKMIIKIIVLKTLESTNFEK